MIKPFKFFSKLMCVVIKILLKVFFVTFCWLVKILALDHLNILQFMLCRVLFHNFYWFSKTSCINNICIIILSKIKLEITFKYNKNWFCLKQ